jgi:hypothetical protein
VASSVAESDHQNGGDDGRVAGAYVERRQAKHSQDAGKHERGPGDEPSEYAVQPADVDGAC